MSGPLYVMVTAVAVGGAIGAVLRVGALRFGKPGHRLPYATFTINVLGSFVIGCSTAWGEPLFTAWFVGGILGGFTTYSTFAVETAKLATEGSGRRAALYVAATLLSCTVAAGLGTAVASGLA